MKSLEWGSGNPYGWPCRDVRDAWGMLLNTHCKRDKFFNSVCAHECGKNVSFLIAAAAQEFEAFGDLCAAPPDALEAMRAMTDRLSFMWCILTAALAWHETPRLSLPSNAPSKLP